MRLTVGARTYTLEPPSVAVTAEVAFVIPTATPALARLAVQALRAFTREYAWVALLVDVGGTLRRLEWAELLADPKTLPLRVRPSVARWWHLETRRSVGSLLNGVALEAARRWLLTQSVRWMFVMHDDAFPVKPGWLSWLHKQHATYVWGVKASERNGMPHASGILFDLDFLRPDAFNGALMPRLPDYDVAEWAAKLCSNRFVALGVPIRAEYVEHQALYAEFAPWNAYDCDVSIDDDREPFFVHLGGGTMNREDITPKLQWARHLLGV